ncbi:hypothetical protein O2W18_08310 [Modestobacter sp. VKM Ac-2983]|nr:hypothetical protein [Modestobacter sp. VKM Ac-2983]MCZ2805100.1 hypothetical protein [Modestobacter sp. VKM Ac-2983]
MPGSQPRAGPTLTGLAGRVREVWRNGALVAAGGSTVEPGTIPPR